MKRISLLSIFFVLLVAFSAVALFAQTSVDDQGNSNEPRGNHRANACYAGGSLAGKCDLEWKWVCGWGIIRVEQGFLVRENLSLACQSLMPAPLPTYTPRASSATGSSSNTATPIPLPTATVPKMPL